MSDGGGRRWAAVAAAAVALATGLEQAATTIPEAPQIARLAALLEPLRDAPIPAGAVVVIAVPAGVAMDDALPASYEAAWQRPDLLWTLDPGSPGAEFLLLLPGARAVPGLAEFWHGGGLIVLRRAAR